MFKKIWDKIKYVIWPVAKPFICGDFLEAEELVNAWDNRPIPKGGADQPEPRLVSRARVELERLKPGEAQGGEV